MRRLVSVAAALCLILSSAGAQQPNTAAASMTLNFTNHPTPGAGPIFVAVPNNGAIVTTITGAPLQPIVLATGNVQAGAFPLGPVLGILDLGFPIGFQFLLNGFAPTTPLEFFARTGSTGQYQIQAAVHGAPTTTQFGLQAAVFDPAVASIVLTAATNVTVAPFGGFTLAIPETQLGDDVTVTYFHQALSFTFYGTTYGRTNIDTNGYITFGNPINSQWQTSIADHLGGPPRIAPFWSDLHMSSVTPSAFGNTSVAPARYDITEATNLGLTSLTIDWRNATEAAGAANQYDFRVTLDSNGQIICRYGQLGLGAGASIPAVGNTFSIVGISPGGNLSTNMASQNLVSTTVNSGTAALPNDAIFEAFTPLPTAFTIDVAGVALGFAPLSMAAPTIYSVF